MSVVTSFLAVSLSELYGVLDISKNGSGSRSLLAQETAVAPLGDAHAIASEPGVAIFSARFMVAPSRADDCRADVELLLWDHALRLRRPLHPCWKEDEMEITSLPVLEEHAAAGNAFLVFLF